MNLKCLSLTLFSHRESLRSHRDLQSHRTLPHHSGPQYDTRSSPHTEIVNPNYYDKKNIKPQKKHPLLSLALQLYYISDHCDPLCGIYIDRHSIEVPL